MLTDHPKINLDLCDKDERTALMKCVQCEFPRCLEILLRKGRLFSYSISVFIYFCLFTQKVRLPTDKM